MTMIWGGAIALMLGMSLSALFHLRWARRLPTLASLSGVAGPAVSCSIVIAARNESARIEKTVRGLLALEEVHVDVIVVDDRSNDATGEIVRRLATEDRRVQLIRVDVLPENWLGKCHACYLGAAAATGEWILFTDADCWSRPDVLVRALRLAAREQADHIGLSPGVSSGSVGARAWHLAFLISLANWFAGVNRDRPGAYIGMGAFNLVRTQAYRQCGGYELLRLSIVDDVWLGLLIARAGFRSRAFIGGDDVVCDWGVSVRQMIRIMEKNYFAVLDFRLGIALIVGLGGMAMWTVALAGPFSGNPAGMAAGVSMLALIMPGCVVARRLGWPLSIAIMTPFVYPALFYALLRSTWVTVSQGGVRWRETFYPLDLLRAHSLQRSRKRASRSVTINSAVESITEVPPSSAAASQ